MSFLRLHSVLKCSLPRLSKQIFMNSLFGYRSTMFDEDVAVVSLFLVFCTIHILLFNSMFHFLVLFCCCGAMGIVDKWRCSDMPSNELVTVFNVELHCWFRV